MFRPDSNRDRTDYSGILMPPDGYRLDRAVGTTYSLDLEALTAVAICVKKISEMPLTHQCVHLCSPQHQSDRKDWIFIIIVV